MGGLKKKRTVKKPWKRFAHTSNAMSSHCGICTACIIEALKMPEVRALVKEIVAKEPLDQ